MSGTGPNVNPNTPGGGASTGIGGTSSTDVTPAWGESLPAWVDTFIAMLASGQSWPKASESLLWELAKEHQALGEGLHGAVDPGIAAGKAVLAGWQVPATPLYVQQADLVLKGDSGVYGLGQQHRIKALQVDDFARETQYSKISINVAFWIGVTAAFIALVSAFFTAGATTPVIGPIAASTRAAIGRILARLAAAAGRDFGAGMATRLAAGRAAQAGSRSLVRTMLTSHLGREIIEEIGEEVFIDAYTQHEQMRLGTRTSWDWDKTKASAIGAGGGAVVGMKVAAPLLSRYGGRIPLMNRLDDAARDGSGFSSALAGFGRDAMHTGLNNMVASPAGSFLANGAVYGDWNPLHSLTAESLGGAFMGGAGRTRTISPTNPEVFHAITHPVQSLQAANAAAAADDAARAARTANASGPPAGSGAGPAGAPPATSTLSTTGAGAQPTSTGAQPPGANPQPTNAGPQSATSTNQQSTNTAGGPQPTGANPQPTNAGPQSATGANQHSTNASGGSQSTGGGGPQTTGGNSQTTSAGSQTTSAGSQTTSGGSQPSGAGGGSQSSSPGGPAAPSGSSTPAPSSPGTGTPATAQQATPPPASNPAGATPSGSAPQASGTAPPGNATTPPGSGTTPPGAAITPPGSGVTPPGVNPDPSGTVTSPGTPTSTGAPSTTGTPGAPVQAAPASGAVAAAMSNPTTPPPSGAPASGAPQAAPAATAPATPNAAPTAGPSSPASPAIGTPGTPGAPSAGTAPAIGVPSSGSATGPAPLFMPGMPSVQMGRGTTSPQGATGSAANPGPANTTPNPAPPAPDPTKTTPNPALPAPDPANAAPPPAPSAAGTATTSPTPAIPAPSPATSPDLANAAPGSRNTTPGPVNTTPGPVNTTPGPVNTTPGPANATSGPGNATPVSTNTTPAPANAAPGRGAAAGAVVPATVPAAAGGAVNAPAVLLPTDPRVRRRVNRLLSDALPLVAPDALPLRDGTIRVTGPDRRVRHVPADVVTRVQRRLRVRVADGAQDDRLRAETAARLGAAIAGAAHMSPMEGSLNALGRLADASPGMMDVIADVARQVVGERWGRLRSHDLSEAGLRVAEEANGRLPEAASNFDAMRVGPLDDRRRAISERAAALGADLANQSGTGTAATNGPAGTASASATNTGTGTAAGTSNSPTTAPLSGTAPGSSPSGTTTAPQASTTPGSSTSGTPGAPRAGTVPGSSVGGTGPGVTGPAASRPAQGVIRGFLGAVRSPLAGATGAFNAYIEARFTEYRHLAGLWSNGAPDRRNDYEAALRRVIADLEAHGRPAPVPPWATHRIHTVATAPAAGPPATSPHATSAASASTASAASPSGVPATSAAAAAPSGTPVPEAVAELADRVRRMRAALEATQDGLRVRAAENDKKTKDAVKRGRSARKKAKEAAQALDAWHAERRRAQLQESRLERIASEHYSRIARNYGAALTRARAVSGAYAAVADAIDRLASGQDPTPAADLAAEVARLTREADTAFAEFGAAMTAARPPQDLLSAGLPSGRLPHLTRLTNVVNRILADNGAAAPISREELLWHMRSDVQALASEDGLVLRFDLRRRWPLRFGRRRQGELRIQLELGEPVEVPNSGRTFSQGMIGSLPQGGSWVSATITRAINAAFGLDLSTLVQLAPHDGGVLTQIKTWAKIVHLGVKFSGGHSESETGAQAEHVLPGQVADNRGDATLLHVPGTYKIGLRPVTRRGLPAAWRTLAQVSEGVGNDKNAVEMWLSHAHTEHAPDRPFRLPAEERPEARFPRYVPLQVEGLESLAEQAVTTAGTAQVPLTGAAREQVRAILTQDLPGHLDVAVDDPAGFERNINDGGRPGVLRVRSEPVSTRMASRPGWKQFQEWLGVTFSGITGSASAARSSGINVKAGVGLAGDSPGSKGWHGLKVLLSGAFQWGWSRSDSVSATRVAIYPLVRRWMGRTNTHDVVMRHHVTIYFPDEGGPRPTVTGDSRMLLQTPEPDSARAGWEVDPEAVVRDDAGEMARNADGTVRFRDDPVPGPPPGRKAEAPAGLGSREGWGGPSTLYLDPVDVARKREEVLRSLRGLGLVPGIRDGLPRPSADTLEAAAQLANLREVREQLSVNGLQSRIDQASQDGVYLRLTRVRAGGGVRYFTMRVRLGAVGRPRYEGWSEAEGHVSLNISSNTAVRSRSRTRSLGISIGLSFGRIAKKLGLHWSGAEGGYSGTLKRILGWASGSTLNEVTLIEGVPTARFGQRYTMEVDRIHPNGRAESLLSPESVAEPVSGRLFVPADQLPEADSVPHPVVTHPTTNDIMRRSTLTGVDVTGIMDKLRSVLPRAALADSAALHELAAFANTRTFLSDTGWLYSEHRADVVVRPKGLRPVQASAGVRVELGDSEFEGVGDPVTGDIALALTSTSANAGAARANGVNVSAGWGVGSPGSVGVGGSVSVSGDHSDSRTTITGDEPITVRTGKQYRYRAAATFFVSGSENGGEVRREVLADRTVRYYLPELSALALYGQGELPLPLHIVADAMERFLTGHLKLDQALVMRVARRYLQQRSAAARDPGVPAHPLVAGHTPQALFEGISERLGRELAERARDLGDLLDPVRQLKKIIVAMPEQVRTRMGLTTFDSVDLYTTTGTSVRMEVLEAVMNRIRAAIPDAEVRDLVMTRALAGMLVGDNWQGTVRNQLSPEGMEWEQPVRVGRHRMELLQIAIDTEILDDPAVLEGRNDETVHIRQPYGYAEEGQARSAGWSVGGGANGGLAGGGHGVGVGAGSHRGYTRSESTGEQYTQLERTASFDGADLVRQNLKVTVTVRRTPLSQGRVGNRLTRPLHSLSHQAGRMARTATGAAVRAARRAPSTGQADPPPLVLIGSAVRLVPDGLTALQRHVKPLDGPLPDARPVDLPESYFPVETTADTLVDAVRAALAADDLLGKEGVQEQWTRVSHALSRMALNAKLKLMMDPEGHPMLRIPIQGGRVVDVWIQARTSEDQLVIGPRENVEVGNAYRRQVTHGTGTDRNRLGPLSRNVDPGQGAWGTSQSFSSGEQAGEHLSANGGVRREKVLNEKGLVVTVASRVDYTVTLRTATVRRDGSERPGRVIELPAPVTGATEVMMTLGDYEAMLARQRSAEHGRGWTFDGEEERAGRRRAPWRRTPSGHPPQSLAELVDTVSGREHFSDRPVQMVAEELRRRLPRLGRSTGPVSLRATSAPADLPVPLTWARLLSRELGIEVRLDVAEQGGVRGYLATPTGGLESVTQDDGGFAAAVATLPTDLAGTAVAHELDLRRLFNRSARQGAFAEQVEAELRDLGVTPPRRQEPIFPRPLWGLGPEESAGSATLGSMGVPAPVDPGSGFVKGRAPADGPLEMPEVRAAWRTVEASDLGENARVVVWPDGDPVLLVITRQIGPVRFRPTVETVPDDRMASTDLRSGSPFTIRLDPDIPPHLVARTMLHEVSHALRELTAITHGAPQGVIRTQLAAPDPNRPAPAFDACAEARVDEYRHLSRAWTQGAPGRRARLRPQIEGLARLIEARGLVAPPPPWSGGPPAVPLPRGSISRLLNQPPPDPAAGNAAGTPAGNGSGTAANPVPPGPRGESREEYWARMRRMSNTTGWIPPEEEEERASSPSKPGRGGGDGEPVEAGPPLFGEARARTVRVRDNDSLTLIARRWLGPGASEEEVRRAAGDWYRANRDVIGDDPDVIRAGQELVPPAREPASKGT
ncbi:hypothetical protein [Sphaerisporangium dianthi]|uniref:Outer membrane channel protein CpnT-like N-terminal domain-containing protein n=1 Tax=Sphaerisporangium dianthi TaxID=1436120 RepID=A0ABV9C9Y8_9ACTN